MGKKKLKGTPGLSVEEVEDDRYLPRWKVNNRVLIKEENSKVYKEFSLVDISATGLCLKKTEKIKKTKNLNLVIYLNNCVAVHAKGHVSWEKNNGKGKMLGIYFDEILNEAQDFIFAYACKASINAFKY